MALSPPIRRQEPHPISHETLRPPAANGRRGEMYGVVSLLAQAARDPRFPAAWRHEASRIVAADAHRGLPHPGAINTARAARRMLRDLADHQANVAAIMRRPTELQPLVLAGPETRAMQISRPDGAPVRPLTEPIVPTNNHMFADQAPAPPQELAARPPITREEAQQLLEAHDRHTRTRPLDTQDPQNWYYQERHLDTRQ